MGEMEEAVTSVVPGVSAGPGSWGQRGAWGHRHCGALRRAARRRAARRWVWSERWGAWYWNYQWRRSDWYVWSGHRWVKPDYWGGLGCSCDDGRCCRMCPHGFQSGPGRCYCCGKTGCCRCSNCEHPCCQQVSPEHVVKRLQKVLSKEDVLGGVLGVNMLHKIAEFIITYPSRD